MFQTALEAYGTFPAGTPDAEKDDKRKQLSVACCLLLKVCLSLIHGVHDLQYTAMVTINKVIDVVVVHRIGHLKVRPSDALQHPCQDM